MADLASCPPQQAIELTIQGAFWLGGMIALAAFIFGVQFGSRHPRERNYG